MEAHVLDYLPGYGLKGKESTEARDRFEGPERFVGEIEDVG